MSVSVIPVNVPTGTTMVAIDAEWYSEDFICKQFTFGDSKLSPLHTVVLWSDKFPVPSVPPGLFADGTNGTFSLVVGDISQNIFDLAVLPAKLDIYMYYSPKDLTAMFGRDRWSSILDRPETISKKRNISGKFDENGTRFNIKDVLGLFNSSLEQAMESVGIDTAASKALAKGWDKGKMNEWATANPDTFLAYAVGDTVLLMETINLRVSQLNHILNNVFDFPLGDYDIKTIKRSSGALVNDVFLRWFANTYPEVFQTVLGLSMSNDNKSWKDLAEVKQDVLRTSDPFELLKLSKSLVYIPNSINGLAAGSISGIGISTHGTGLFGTVVQGGRCINEEPHVNMYDNRIENVIDIDLSSCYGSALRNFDFPVGLPTIYGKKEDDLSITLGEFLDRYNDDLVDGLYTIYISGDLGSFRQDLIFSKYDVTTDTIIRKLFSDMDAGGFAADDTFGHDVDLAHMGGTFALTKQQIKLGIITADVLSVVKKVASLKEWQSIRNLAVETVVYYPKSLQLSNAEWVHEIRTKPGTNKFKKDDRNRSWTSVSLEGFIGNFIKLREVTKKEGRELHQDKYKGSYQDLVQNSIKLFINTAYGCLAAPYFEMGNTVVANNITAKARVGVWMMSKALMTVQSITDGGMFSGSRVASLVFDSNKKKPSLTAMSNRTLYLKHRSLRTTVLLTSEGKKEAIESKTLDAICTEYINKFWANWNLSIPFDIECKTDNCGDVAVYFGSSDYLIRSGDKYQIKMRGTNDSKHPKQLFIHHILDKTKPVPSPIFQGRNIVGLNDYLRFPTRYKEKGLLPGDDESVKEYHRPFKNGQTFLTYEDRKKFEFKNENHKKRWVKKGDFNLFGLAAKASGMKYPSVIDQVSE